jgi:two-component system, chemotaxis family, chemotaxis protein CheY
MPREFNPWRHQAREDDLMATVLVVDDEPGLRTVMRRVLEGKGYRVVEAADGNQALALFRRESPALVISDIIMPNRDGIEVIVAMKAENPAVKVLAISGGGRVHAMGLLALAPRAGADATLDKPFRQSELLKLVAGLIGEPGREG